jgi:hypothetical protein
MSSANAPDFESLLREAFAPVEPSPQLSERLEMTLESLTELAVDELDSWELSAMRDPRNWARPVIAGAIGAAAGTGLIIMRARRRRAQAHRRRDVAGRALEEVFELTRRLRP